MTAFICLEQWKQKNGCLRILKMPANHVAQLKESYNIKDLLLEPLMSFTKIITLSGYSKSYLHLFIFYMITTVVSFLATRKN
jgi:hypothetical protein